MRSSAKRLWSNQSGAIAAVYALALPALIAVGGIAFDYARLAALDTELQNAADQAALAAATQLDQKMGSCNRAITAARDLLKRAGNAGDETGNVTLFANDGFDRDITIGTQAAGCTAAASDPVRFYTTAEGNTLASSDVTARFVEVTVGARTARYALTPIVGAFNSGAISAKARAGVGSAICKVPPLMICNPDPTKPFDADGKRGWGVRVTGHGNDQNGPDDSKVPGSGAVGAWAPGDFGFLDVGSGQNSELKKTLAFQNPGIPCLQTETGNVSTGNPQGLYDAFNTRFDIYDLNGNVLDDCATGACPAALNVVKDVVKSSNSNNNNQCKIGSSGWSLLPEQNRFHPRPYSASDTAMTQVQRTDFNTTLGAMGLPRDNCHYGSYSRACGNDPDNRFGNGVWARGDYFYKYHPTNTPLNAANMTRYETYLWELADASRIPNGISAGTDSKNKSLGNQYGRPTQCSTGTVAPGTDRRVLAVAVVNNCSQLSGSSRAVVIGEFVDMFLVEPSVDGRANGGIKDQIYMEIIGKSRASGNGSIATQTFRRDAPYLVQ